MHRSISFENLGAQADPTAPIYEERNPDRDKLGDMQSILDRISIGDSTRYEPPTEERPRTYPSNNPNKTQEITTVIQAVNKLADVARPAVGLE